MFGAGIQNHSLIKYSYDSCHGFIGGGEIATPGGHDHEPSEQ